MRNICHKDAKTQRVFGMGNVECRKKQNRGQRTEKIIIETDYTDSTDSISVAHVTTFR